MATWAPRRAGRALGESPDLDLRDHLELVAQFKQDAVAFGGALGVEVGLVGRPDRRGGEPFTADLADHLQIAAGLFKPLFPFRVVIDDPLKKTDGALDREAKVVMRRPRSLSEPPSLTYWSSSRIQGSTP